MYSEQIGNLSEIQKSDQDRQVVLYFWIIIFAVLESRRIFIVRKLSW
jgi:hypothetical protein